MSYDISLYVKSFLDRALAEGLGDWTGADPIPAAAVDALVALVRAEGFVAEGGSEHRLESSSIDARLHIHTGEITFSIPSGPKAMASIELCTRVAGRIAADHGLAVWDPQAEEGDDTHAWLDAIGDGVSSDLRVQAARKLGGRDASRVVSALVRAAREDRSVEVRRVALEAIGNLGPGAASAVDAVSDLLTDRDSTVAYWATYALGRLGPSAAPALPKLEALTKSSEDGPRYGAVDAIRRIRAATR